MKSLTEAATEKSKLTLAAGKATQTLFCSYHQGYANATTGKYLLRNKTKRWMCEGCLKIRGIAP